MVDRRALSGPGEWCWKATYIRNGFATGRRHAAVRGRGHNALGTNLLSSGNGLENYQMGTSFPLPQNGQEVL